MNNDGTIFHFGSLDRYTRDIWQDLARRNGWIDEAEDLRPWMLLEQGTLLYFRLRAMPDEPQYFPNGKQSDLGKLQNILEIACGE